MRRPSLPVPMGSCFAALMSQSICSSGQGREERRLALLRRLRRADVIIDYLRVSPWVIAVLLPIQGR